MSACAHVYASSCARACARAGEDACVRACVCVYVCRCVRDSACVPLYLSWSRLYVDVSLCRCVAVSHCVCARVSVRAYVRMHVTCNPIHVLSVCTHHMCAHITYVQTIAESDETVD